MYIEKTERYWIGTEQAIKRARFLIIMHSKDRPLGPNNFNGIVRKVALRQLGHWMMGFARIGKEKITVSGSYGGDGLSITVDENTFQKGKPIPLELYNKWNNGGGWNSAGNEARAMVKWAQENF